ncbi:MAG TPA: antirestriction protein [Albidovulum sp.]|uniref:antirestriction protein n=1 Tax=Albidovulum sp. TaxID=1872424 RepID=UPI002C2B7DA8|nr:antirestriction protein [Albidovulum sp.]
MSDFRPATLVPEDRRQDFLPELFGLNRLIVAENFLYALMDQLSPLDYGGGYWAFHELDGKPLFLAPTSKPRFRLRWEGNGYEGEVSAETAGIIATMFALSHLSIRFGDDRFSEAFLRLYEFAADHPEAGEIFQAID